MGTQTLELEQVVNFLDLTIKKNDIRFSHYNELTTSGIPEKTIYWLGIIKLAELSKNKTCYPIYFPMWNGNLKKDLCVVRDERGKIAQPRKTQTILFDFSGMMNVLEDAHRINPFFNVMLKDTVYQNGMRRVDVVSPQINHIGFGTQKLWFRTKDRALNQYSSVLQSTLIHKHTILFEEPYRFLKWDMLVKYDI